MSQENSALDREILTVVGPDGAAYSFTAAGNGGYFIERNGERMEGKWWPDSELRESLADYIRITDLNLSTDG